MDIFNYGDVEVTHLKKRDKALGAAIDTIGQIQRKVNSDLFSALVNSIVGQQISTKAHITIWERMKGGLVEITPQTILACTEAELQSFGISFKKVRNHPLMSESAFPSPWGSVNLLLIKLFCIKK
jgi:DNA-3-methyladenine glycosylase II